MTRNRNLSAHHGPLSRAPWFNYAAAARQALERQRAAGYAGFGFPTWSGHRGAQP